MISLSSIVARLKAGTALIGKVAAHAETSKVLNGTTELTPKFAFVNVAASQTDAQVVAAVAGKKIRVLALVMVCGGTATTITFNTKPVGAGTAISPLFANGANGGAVIPFNPVGWFETSADQGLSATTGDGSATGVQVVYVEV
jgi:hypothetical protein